jgi:transposase
LDFKRRQLYPEGALSAVGAGEVVAASEYRALQHQVRELQLLLGEKTLEKNEILREALNLAQPKKRLLRSPLPAREDIP